MKKNKLLLILLLLTTIPVYALNKVEKDGIELSLDFNKEEYKLNEEIVAIINIKNNNEFEINNIKTEIILPKGYSLVDTIQDNINLEANQSNTNTYKIINNSTLNNPNTGNNLNIYIVVLLISLILLISILIYQKKTTKIIPLILIISLIIPSILKVDASNTSKEIELSSTIKYNEEDITIKVKITYESDYNKVTVTNGTGSGMYQENDIVNISADEIDNKIFVKWYVEEGNIILDNINNTNTSFIMNNEEIIIKALYKDPCNDPNCVSCPEKTNVCTECAENYELNSVGYCETNNYLED